MHKDTPADPARTPRSSLFQRTIDGGSLVSPRTRVSTIGARNTLVPNAAPRDSVQKDVSITGASPFWSEDSVPSGGVHHPELAPTDIPVNLDQVHEDSPFRLTLLDAATGHHAMALPPRWRVSDLIWLVEGHGGPEHPTGKPPRLGIDRVWLQDGQLHVVGRYAERTLKQLTHVLVLLRELGVGSPQEPGFLEVLKKAPALMVASSRQLQFHPAQQDSQSLVLHADREWVSCVLGQFTTHWPSLGCRLFLHLTPELQHALVRRCPTVFDCMVANLSALQDQRALGAVFEAGLKSRLRPGGAATSFLPWLERCPPWAAASLLDIWDAHDDSRAKQWWLHESPQLANALSVLGDMARPVRHVGLPPTEAALDVLRQHGGVQWQGSDMWDLAIKLIRVEVGRLVTGEIADDALNDCYGRIVETLNLMPYNNRAAAVLHSVMQELAEQFQRNRVQDKRMDWLLNKIFRSAERAFSEAAGIAFQRLCESPTPDACQLHLRPDEEGAFSVVDCADPVHLRWILAAMVRVAGAQTAFQERVALNMKTRSTFKNLLGTDLFGPDTPVQGTPGNLAAAHWRIQLTYRQEFAQQLFAQQLKPRDSQALAPKRSKAQLESNIQLEVMASILKGAAHDIKTPIQPGEMALLASYISSTSCSPDLLGWLSQLLERHAVDPKYAECVSSMILNAVAQLYAKGGKGSEAHRFADALMMWLCRDERVPIRFDARFAGPSLHSCNAWTTETLIRWQKELGLRTRAAQRACVWMAELLTELDPVSTGRVRQELVMYVRGLGDQKRLNQLNANERGILAVWRGLYAKVWKESCQPWTEEEFEAAMQEMRDRAHENAEEESVERAEDNRRADT